MGMLDGLMLGGVEVALYVLLVALLGLSVCLAARGAARLRRSRLEPTLTVEAGVVALNAGRRVTFQGGRYLSFVPEK